MRAAPCSRCTLGTTSTRRECRACRDHEGVMGIDSGGGTSNQDSFADRDDVGLEPEIIRWLGMYAGAAYATHNATVADILDEVNRLLSRYRRESAAYRREYAARLRELTEQ